MAGRFDLLAPEGACNVADSAAAALRERLGRRLVARATVTAAELDGAVVSALRVPVRERLGDLCSRGAAALGVTREIHAVTPYALTQTWAAALRSTGLGGVRYDARFSTGRDRAYALWGPEGGRTWPTGPAPALARNIATSMDIAVVLTPATVPVIIPPT